MSSPNSIVELSKRDASAENTPRYRIALTADPELPVPPLYYGGIERIVDVLARGLEERGHEVVLFAHPESSSAGRLVPWRGRSSANHADTAINAAILTRHVLAGRFDLIHSFSRIAYMTALLPFPIPKLMSYQRQISARSVAMARALSLNTLSFSAVSRAMVGGLSTACDWRIVPNGVPLDAYDFVAAPEHDAPLVFLGRIEAIKGPHIAIEVARRTGASLVIAGNVAPEHRAWFDATVAPHIDGRRIKYVGPVNDAQKNALLGNARALLMPIRWEEPFGIVMAEALACGTPVIGFARGAVPEVVGDGVTGFVVNDVDEMVAAVGNIDRLDRYACRLRAERSFSSTALVEGYLAVYGELIGGRRRAQPSRSPAQ
jgi:glycosyltransferase involved in cell wall biosynthesis